MKLHMFTLNPKTQYTPKEPEYYRSSLGHEVLGKFSQEQFRVGSAQLEVTRFRGRAYSK